eukprot:gene20364-23131_t
MAASVDGSELFSEVRFISDVGGGRGVFALSRLPPGSLILSERPFLLWKDGIDFGDTDDLSTAVLQVLQSQKALQCSKQLYPQTIESCEGDELAEVRRLFERYDPNDLNKLAAAGEATVDEVLRVALTLQHNGFNSGLYEKQSLLNHSCTPNCLKLIPASKHGCSEIWTTRDIEQGEELTICYVNPLESTSKTIREYLLRNHKFLCLCPKCIGKSTTTGTDNAILSDDADADLMALESDIQRSEVTLADLGGTLRKSDGAVCQTLQRQAAELLAFHADAAALRPALYAPLLARLHKLTVSLVVRQVSLCEQYSLPVTPEVAVAYVKSNICLLDQQLLYLPASHPDLAATLSDLGDAILALKQQFPASIGDSFDTDEWSRIVNSFSTAPQTTSTPTITAVQCAKASTARSKQLRSLYFTALRCPLALRLLSAPPGAVCWGGHEGGELGGLGTIQT